MQLVPHREQLVSVKNTSHLVLHTEVRDFAFRPVGIRRILRGRNEDVFVDEHVVTTEL
jgi:hypothetical protein